MHALCAGGDWPQEFVLGELAKWHELGLVVFLADPLTADEKDRVIEFKAIFVPPDWKLRYF